MTRLLLVGYQHSQFAIHDFDEETQESAIIGLPPAARALSPDIQTWQDYREQHWSPPTGWDDDTRWWYAQEARRLERVLRSLLSPGYRVLVSPWPAVTELTVRNEYGSDWPVWDFEGLTDPDDEPFKRLTPPLRAALHAWAEYFERHYHHTRGWRATSSGFHEEGRRLRDELARELGSEYEIGLSEWTM